MKKNNSTLLFYATLLFFSGVFSLEYRVSQFNVDFGGNPTDTSKVVIAGTSLGIAVERRVLQHGLKPVDLPNGVGINGRSGANPVVRSLPGRDFRIAYISWNTAQVPNTGAASTYIPPQANILLRSLRLSDDGVSLDSQSVVAVSSENPTDEGKIFYGGAQDRRPPPAYLQLSAGSGGAYALYWSTLQLSGSLRRTSDLDSVGRILPSRYGKYVPSGTPDLLGYVGALGSAPVPGTSGRQVVLAYEKSISPASAVLRWENIANGTSSALTFSRPGVSLMEDFAVSVDAAGTALVLWREGDSLMGTAYTSAQTLLLSPRRMASGNLSGDKVPLHTYRSYGVAALSSGNFVFVYAIGGQVYYRTLNVQSGIFSTPVALTAAGFDCQYPDVASSSNYVVFTWYGNTEGGSRRVVAARFSLNGGVIDDQSRTDYPVSLTDVSFNVGEGWKPYHNYRVPVVAVNDVGDFTVVYDHEFGAKASAWVNLPLYWDTASFTSGSIRLGNKIQNLWPDTLIDSMALTDVSYNPTTSVKVGFFASRGPASSTPVFTPLPLPGKLASPLKYQAGYFKYQVQLLAQQGKTKQTSLDSLVFGYNFKPQVPLPQYLLLGKTQVPWKADSTYTLYARRDSLSLSVFGVDIDIKGLRFIYTGLGTSQIDSSVSYQGEGKYANYKVFPPLAKKTLNARLSLVSQDPEGWSSSPIQTNFNYINSAPELVAQLRQKQTPLTGSYQKRPLELDSSYSLVARDSAYLSLLVKDVNDDTLNVQVKRGSEVLFTGKWAQGREAEIPLYRGQKVDSIPLVITLSDPDTSLEFNYRLTYTNAPPLANFILGYRTEPRSGTVRDTSLVTGDSLRIWARDSNTFSLIYTDQNDTLSRVRIQLGSTLLTDTSLAPGKKYQIKIYESKGHQRIPLDVAITDPDSSYTYRIILFLHNDVPGLQTRILKNRGQDFLGRFRPAQGQIDTLFPPLDSQIVFHIGDSSWLPVTVTDTLDDSLMVFLYHDTSLVSEYRLKNGNTRMILLPGQVPRDTFDLKVTVRDPDTSVFYRFKVVTNKIPVLTKVESSHAGENLSGYDTFGSTPQLRIIPNLENKIQVKYRNAEGQSLVWVLWKRPDSCERARYSCYLRDTLSGADSLLRVFKPGEEKLLFRVTDQHGAFVQDTFDLVFPFIDTSETAGSAFRERMRLLQDSTRYIIGSSRSYRMDTLILKNTGSGPLRIHRLATSVNNQKWMEYQAFWNSSQGPQSPLIKKNTHLHPLEGPLWLPSSSTLTLVMRFFVDSLIGDGRLTDNLIIESDDYYLPKITVPFGFSYIDLPKIEINPGISVKRGEGFLSKESGRVMPESLGLRTAIAIRFSEPVWDSLVDSSSIQIFSLKDSAKTGRVEVIAGHDARYFRRYYTPLSSGQGRVALTVDSLLFIPHYKKKSASRDIQPPPGNFVPGDSIVVRVSNTITDTSGNPLDLNLKKELQTAGSQDSTLIWQVQSRALRVLSTQPASGAGHNAEHPVRIIFSPGLVPSYIHDFSKKEYAVLDTGENRPAASQSLRVVSVLHPEPYAFRYIRLKKGDSLLEFMPAPKFFKGDTVRVTLFSSLGDGEGRTLDGDADGVGNFWYNELDTLDQYSFQFPVEKAEFYLYPNPFRRANEAHARKGGISFKNWNLLPGIKPGVKISFRIYTLSADQVFNSDHHGQSPIWQEGNVPEWEWKLINDSGQPVASGLYIFTVFVKDKLVSKGKMGILQ